MLFICLIIGQWGQDNRLTTAAGYSFNGLTLNSVTVGPSNRVHVCWWDYRDGNAEIYYKQSTDDGETWGSDVRLTDTAGTDFDPAIACAGNDVHIIWRCGNRIFYMRSTDAGQTWQPKRQLHSGGTMIQSPSIAVSGDTVYAAWVRAPGAFPPYHALFRRSLDGGATWLDTIRISPPGYDTCADCALVVDKAKRVHFFWTNSWYSIHPAWGLYTRRSTDFGATWSAPVELHLPCAITLKFSCAAGPDSNVLHYIVLGNYGGGSDYNLEYKRSSDAGLTWNQYFFKAAGASWALWEFPEVAVDTATGSVNIAWVWNAAPTVKGEIMYNCSDDNGLTWGIDERLTYNDSISTRPSMSCGSVHLIWTDTRDGDYEIYYKKRSTVNVSELIGHHPRGMIECHPSLFTDKTNILYRTTDLQMGVSMNIYDINGRIVRHWDRMPSERSGSILWDGTDDLGNELPAGIYHIVVNNGRHFSREKVLLIR